MQQGKFPLVSYSASFLISNKPSEYARTAFTMLKMFGLEHEVEKFVGPQANANILFNVLTLCYEMHQAYDSFDIWLEEVPGLVRFTLCPNLFLSHDKTIQSQENTYNVVIAEEVRRGYERQSPRPTPCVTFKVNPDCAAFCKENNVALPELPSRDLIGLRAACARVAHLSSVAEQIRQNIYEDATVIMTAY